MANTLEKRIEDIKNQISHENIREIIFYDTKDGAVGYNGNALYKEKEALFKISEYKKNKNDGYDCDVALRTMVLYSIAYPFINKYERKIECQKTCNKDGYKYEVGDISKNEFVYRGDTMNSYYTTLNEFLRLYGDDEVNPKVLEIHPSTKKLNFTKEDGSWEDCILNHKDYFTELLPIEITEFLGVVHTIGNFIPVPFKGKGIEFNRPRGLAVKDYWDITLLAIYNWFQKKNNLETLYGIGLIDIVNTDESVEMCEKWLGEFADEKGNLSWDKFIVDNYMQDFVNLSNVQGQVYGSPRELWVNHFKQIPNGDKKPKARDEFIQFFSNATALIISRGSRVAMSIKKKST